MEDIKKLEKELEKEVKGEMENLGGGITLVILFLVGFISIIFGNPIFKLIGWVTLGLILLTSIHILYKNKLKKGGEKWQMKQ